MPFVNVSRVSGVGAAGTNSALRGASVRATVTNAGGRVATYEDTSVSGGIWSVVWPTQITTPGDYELAVWLKNSTGKVVARNEGGFNIVGEPAPEPTPEPQPEPEPTPTPTPTPGDDPLLGHLGAVIVEDDMAPNPRPVWGDATTPYQDSGRGRGGAAIDPARDPFVLLEPSRFPFVPHGRSAIDPQMRTLISPDPPPQSIYDEGVHKYAPGDPNAQTRTQLEQWSWTNPDGTFWFGREGDHVAVLVPFLLDPVMSIKNPMAQGGGNTKYTQLVQFKAEDPGAGNDVTFAMFAAANGVKSSPTFTGSGLDFWDPVPCKLGAPQLLAIEMLVSASATKGGYRLYGKIDGVQQFKTLSPWRPGPLIHPDRPLNMGIGPYSKCALIEGRGYKCSYGRVQVVAWR